MLKNRTFWYFVGVFMTWTTSTYRARIETLPGSIGDQEWAKVSSPPAGAFQVQISVIRHTECAIASDCSSVFCLGSIPTLHLHQLLAKKNRGQQVHIGESGKPTLACVFVGWTVLKDGRLVLNLPARCRNSARPCRSPHRNLKEFKDAP